MANIDNLIPGQGRKKGSLNRKTIIQNDKFREEMEKDNAIYKIYKLLMSRIESGDLETIRNADAIKLFSALAPYQITTITEQENSERLDDVVYNSETPEQLKQNILDYISALK